MNYENIFICPPDLPAERVEELISKASKIIESQQGKVKSVQQVGKKKLSYPIKGFREGIYVFLDFEAGGDTVGKLENFFKLSGGVIRFLTIKNVEKKKAQKLSEPKGASEASYEPAK